MRDFSPDLLSVLARSYTQDMVVESEPPTSFVMRPASIARMTAFSIVLLACDSPRWSSIIATVRMEPKGFAMFLPANCGALP